LSDEQEDSHSLVGWIIGVAVTIAVAVAVLIGIMSALDSDSSKGNAPVSAATALPSSPSPSSPTNTASPASQTSPSTPATLAAPTPAKIHFDVNSFATPVGTNQLLTDLVAYSKSSPNSKLSISGFHDKTGDVAKNQELAKNRAKVVKDLLLSAGVPEDRILMQKPAETTGGSDDKEARRVEVSAAQ
jgi:outer membrane protein OmpA-like peptidoglycan-associated protein